MSHTVVWLIEIICFPYFLFCHECAFRMRGNAVTSECHVFNAENFPNALSLSLYISLILFLLPFFPLSPFSIISPVSFYPTSFSIFSLSSPSQYSSLLLISFLHYLSIHPSLYVSFFPPYPSPSSCTSALFLFLPVVYPICLLQSFVLTSLLLYFPFSL